MHLWHIGALGIIARGVESRLRPVLIKRAMGPLLKEYASYSGAAVTGECPGCQGICPSHWCR